MRQRRKRSRPRIRPRPPALWIAAGALLLASGAAALWWRWVEARTEDYFVGASLARVRWTHLTDQQRLRSTCLGAHGVQDALQGHPRDFCLPFLPELKAEFARNGLDWEQESRRAREEMVRMQEKSGDLRGRSDSRSDSR